MPINCGSVINPKGDRWIGSILSRRFANPNLSDQVYFRLGTLSQMWHGQEWVYGGLWCYSNMAGLDGHTVLGLLGT